MERSVVWVKMNEEFSHLRAILAKTHPVRSEQEMREVCAVLAFLCREAEKWQGKEQLPFYERGALLEAVYADNVEDILTATDRYLEQRRQDADKRQVMETGYTIDINMLR